MKRYILFLLIMLMTQMASAQDYLFNKYKNTEGVTSVYISKTLLKMSKGYKVGEMDLRRVVDKLDYLRILTCERASLIQTIRKDAMSTLSKASYEEMLSVNKGGEHTIIYMKKRGAKNEFLLLSVDKDDLNMIQLMGTLTLADIQEIGL